MRFPFTPYWKPMQRFWPKVSKANHPKGCWVWRAAKDRKGYGYFGWNHISYAHRFVYEANYGPIPEGMTIHHVCGTTSCVRPSHLEPLSDEENNRRADTFRFRNRRKTHCKHGHPFDSSNTYIRPAGERECRTCTRHHSREARRRKRPSPRFIATSWTSRSMQSHGH